MNKFLVSAVCCAVLACAARAQSRPPRNYEDRGACPFECCTYRDWGVRADTVFYKTRSTKSGVAFHAKKGESVRGLTGVVITIEPGRAVATGDMKLGGNGSREVKVDKGAMLYLLHYQGEGFYKIWYRGRIYEDQPESDAEHAARPPNVSSLPYIRLLREPNAVWWVRVRDRRGRTGWSMQTRHFGDMDACG